MPLDWSKHGAGDPYNPAAVRDRDLRQSETGDGCAVHTAGGNLVAYAFYHRVRDLAHRYDVSTEQVLACAIAHELGHLLLPVRGHSADGLMRACWSRERVSARRTGAAEVFGRRESPGFERG